MTDQTNWAKVLGELLADHELFCEHRLAAVTEATAPFSVRLAALETRPIEKGDPGEQGPPGSPGPPGEPGEISKAMVPPELAAEIAGAVRLLHESPPVVQRSEPAGLRSSTAPPKLTRIERDAQGNFVPVYDGA